MKKLIIYTNDSVKYMKINTLCRKLGVSTVKLDKGDINYTIASIIQGDRKEAPIQKAPLFYVMKDVMVFSDFTDSELDMFLSMYKSSGIEAIPLKCVVTPFNYLWSVYQVVEELTKEHKYFTEKK